MDNLLFESQMIFSKALIKEYVRALCFKRIVLLFLFPLTIIVVGIFLLAFTNNFNLLGIGIFCTLVMLIVLFIRLHIDIKRIYAITREQGHEQDRTNIVKFFEGNFYTVNNMTDNRIGYTYDVLKKFIISKNLVIIVTTAGAMICLEKSKFSVGTLDGLLEFLKDKINQNKDRK